MNIYLSVVGRFAALFRWCPHMWACMRVCDCVLCCYWLRSILCVHTQTHSLLFHFVPLFWTRFAFFRIIIIIRSKVVFECVCVYLCAYLEYNLNKFFLLLMLLKLFGCSVVVSVIVIRKWSVKVVWHTYFVSHFLLSIEHHHHHHHHHRWRFIADLIVLTNHFFRSSKRKSS